MNNFLFIEDPKTKEKRINVVAVALLATLTLPIIYAAKRIVSKVLISRTPVKLEDVAPTTSVTEPVSAVSVPQTNAQTAKRISPALSAKVTMLENILAKRPENLDTTKFVAKDAVETTTSAAKEDAPVVDVKAKSKDFAALFAQRKAPVEKTEVIKTDAVKAPVQTVTPALPPRPVLNLSGAKLKPTTPVAKDVPAPRSTATTGAAPTLAEQAVAQRAKMLAKKKSGLS